MKDQKLLLGVAGFIIFAVLTGHALADDVKYCRDAKTGKIIVVKAGMPCPYPTHEV